MLTTVVSLVTITTLTIGLWQLALRSRAHGVNELRGFATSFRTTFQDVIAHGGLDKPHFLAQEARDREAGLTDLIDQVRNDELRRRAEKLLDIGRQVFANAPPRLLPIQTSDNSPTYAIFSNDPNHTYELTRQVSAARDGLVAVQRVLDQCNRLTRRIVLKD